MTIPIVLYFVLQVSDTAERKAILSISKSDVSVTSFWRTCHDVTAVNAVY